MAILNHQFTARRLRALADMRGIWSLGDQAILSLGNFLTTRILLGTLSPWYGDYFRVINIIWFLNNLHMAMVTYPISITSVGVSEPAMRRRFRHSIVLTLLLLIPESIAVSVACFSLGQGALVPWAIAALGFWQLQETVRRALMARLEHRRAIAGDLISYLGQALAIFLIVRHGSISITMVYALIAITSAAAMVLQMLQLRLYQLGGASDSLESIANLARRHFQLGRWLLLSSTLNLLTLYSMPWFIGHFYGSHFVDRYSAVLCVLNLSNPLLAAVANLITPVVANAKAAADARGETDGKETARLAMKYSAQGAAVLFPCFAILILMPGTILHGFYRHVPEFWSLTGPVRIFSVVYAMMYVSAVINSYLCGLGRSKVPFLGQTANAIVTCVITIPLVAMWGITGAAIGGLFTVSAQLSVGIYHVYQLWRKTPEHADSSATLVAQPA
jgi:O-antigen/teichoic acid export membrane protein